MSKYEIASVVMSSIAILCSISTMILSLLIKRQTAILSLKPDYEKIIDFCKNLAKTNSVETRLKNNLGEDIDELTLFAHLFGKKCAKQFNKFKSYNTQEFGNFIKTLEEKYKKVIGFAKRII